MAKFSSIVLGKKAEKRITMPPVDGSEETPDAVICVLDGIDEEQVMVAARERALAKGVKDPKLGEPIYEMALMVETIAKTFMDPDSAETDRQAFFDGGPEQVRRYGREAIHYLYQLQQTFQDEVSPTLLKLNAKETVDAMVRIGSPDEHEARSFLEHCRPGLLLILARSMGVLLRGSQMLSFSSGKSSEADSTNSSSSSAS